MMAWNVRELAYGPEVLLAALLLPLFAWSQQNILKMNTPSVSAVPQTGMPESRNSQSQPSGATAMIGSELRDKHT
jgi:hypothetical protein